MHVATREPREKFTLPASGSCKGTNSVSCVAVLYDAIQPWFRQVYLPALALCVLPTPSPYPWAPSHGVGQGAVAQAPGHGVLASCAPRFFHPLLIGSLREVQSLQLVQEERSAGSRASRSRSVLGKGRAGGGSCNGKVRLECIRVAVAVQGIAHSRRLSSL